MSVIAWDGKTLAADRQATAGNGRKMRATKIYQLDSGAVVGFVGDLDQGARVLAWMEAGAKDEDFPKPIDEESRTTVIIAQDGECQVCWGDFPLTHAVDEPFYAFGSGADLALGALAVGATAVQAVEIACQFNADCGRGVVAYDVMAKPVAPKRKRK